MHSATQDPCPEDPRLPFFLMIPIAEVSESAQLPWCSFCGESCACIANRLDDSRKWYYYCYACALKFKMVGGEGVRFGPTGVSWGQYRSDPVCSFSSSGDVDSTADVGMGS